MSAETLEGSTEAVRRVGDFAERLKQATGGTPALREAAEETGVDRSGIDVLGVLPPAYVEVSGFDVTAVIAWWREPSPVAVIDSREAASIDIVPVAVLTDPAHRARVRHPSVDATTR